LNLLTGLDNSISNYSFGDSHTVLSLLV